MRMLSDAVMESLTGSMDSAYKRGMELSVLERLTLAKMVAPKEGNLVLFRLVKEFLGELSFSSDEHEALRFVETAGMLTWEPVAALSIKKDVTIQEPIRVIIVEAFGALDAASKLTMETAALYERFLPKEEVAVP